MNNIINKLKSQITLTGEAVELLPLEEKHFPELINLAKDKRIWEFYAFDGTDFDTIKEVLATALLEKEKGNHYPFIIRLKQNKKIIGSTRFLDIQPKHKKLEIGHTWLHPDYWATAINFECKLLLLTYCFESLHAVRVQLKTNENNWRSRKAIEKIGGQFEGILRSDMLQDNGTKRNSAYFSILEEEWGGNKNRLTELYQAKKLQVAVNG